MRGEGRPATSQEQQVLARWSSWGAIPQVFDPTNEAWAPEREQLRAILTDDEFDAARRTTINAHYTDAAIVEAMWSTMSELGFDGGRVLEPGSGAGTFIGMAPQGALMTGVELDPVTAGIAQSLYPQATIRNESFADTRFPNGTFDAAIGNVPFANVTLHDPVGNQGRHSMHNHFIIKALQMTRPGGLVATLTSSYTMDASNPMAREEMHDLADLVGALRLPNGAHRRAAGTEALTDLLIFRRRPDNQKADASRDAMWTSVGPLQLDSETRIHVNTYFLEHPQRVLGTFAVAQGEGGREQTVVRPDETGWGPEQLREALADIVAKARRESLTALPVSEEQRRDLAQVEQLRTDLLDGTVVEVDDEQYPSIGDERFQIAAGGLLEPFKVPKTQVAETSQLLALRDGARDLLMLERGTEQTGETPELSAARAQLKADYERYVNRYGAINRYTVSSTGKLRDVIDPLSGLPVIDPDTGEAEQEMGTRRVLPPAVSRLVREDPNMALVTALENFDDATQLASPALILTERQIVHRTFAEEAETAADALSISIDKTGRADLEVIAELLSTNVEDARERLGTLVFDDPSEQRLVPAAEYLSGNVRIKLEQAEEAAQQDPQFAPNVEALREVQPAPTPLEDIRARLGAVWIDVETHQQFLRETLRDPNLTLENPAPDMWIVSGNRRSVAATAEWGTERVPAPKLAEKLLSNATITVQDKDSDGKRYPNPVETQAALDKGEELQDRFAEWVWEDPERTTRLQAAYDRAFNSLVLRDYAEAGKALTLPGLAETFTPREHQRSAIARMVAEPAVGLFHEVGAGKTLEMVAGTMELKRLGLISKPAVVVPNHMLRQFTREWLQAYPSAQLLAAGSNDLDGTGRRKFVSRAAANDWDAVVMTQGAFKSLGVTPETESEYMNKQIEQAREFLDKARDAGLSDRSIKQVEKDILKQEEKLKASLDVHRDAGVTFEATGIDYLVVDEAHMYKNLRTHSKKQAAQISGSQAATDLELKIGYLRGQHGMRVATFATATPIANSITEAHVMQRYLRPDLLEAAGLNSFDAWLNTFTIDTPDMEVSPTGQFRMKERLKFTNVADMMKMWHVFADVKTAEDLNLPTPLVAQRASDGKRDVENVTVLPSARLQDYQAELTERAKKLAGGGVDPQHDNMLKVSGEGRAAALDLRLIDENEYAIPDGDTKLNKVADTILAEWERTRDNVYLDARGEPSELKGGLQIVFSDMGTPSTERWNVYHALRGMLVRGGMPAESVRFIHEAKNDADKARMFEAARNGTISVLIGSTNKMGVGTNVQDRVTALHHIDCPWRPADIRQREGRAIRQGNQNAEVNVYRYLTEGSFDGYTWQTIARKEAMVTQIMRGDPSLREMEDVSDMQLSAGVATAIGSGNPLLLEKAQADQEVNRLRRRQSAHNRSQTSLVATRDRARTTIMNATSDLALLRPALEKTVAVDGDHFRMSVGQSTLTKRADAADAIASWANREHIAMMSVGREPVQLGTIGGHDVLVSRENSHDGRDLRRMVVLELAGVPGSASRHPLEDVLKPSLGTVRVLENKTTAIGGNITKLEQAQDTLASAEANIGKPFVDADALEAARDRAADLAAQLAESTSEEDEPTAAADGAHPQAERPQTRVEASAPARYVVEASEPVQITGEGRQRLTNALEKLRAKNESATEPERPRSRFEPHHDVPSHQGRSGPGRSL
ncbi:MULTISPECIES: helicase-related protein [Dermacoccus]|uniref:Helicase n=2 Tax=Dermacoccus TaxID=57495 RepID=A0A417Z1D9_9MICO|nr:helicase-related protein [Dermacoccus abyssi]RHW44020.1 helicase [Dermacoccus abyssi]